MSNRLVDKERVYEEYLHPIEILVITEISCIRQKTKQLLPPVNGRIYW